MEREREIARDRMIREKLPSPGLGGVVNARCRARDYHVSHWERDRRKSSQDALCKGSFSVCRMSRNHAGPVLSHIRDRGEMLHRGSARGDDDCR